MAATLLLNSGWWTWYQLSRGVNRVAAEEGPDWGRPFAPILKDAGYTPFIRVAVLQCDRKAVSYTHLTLPTSDLV